MAGVAKMLKDIMKTSGWTQEQLAGKLGVSFASLNSWINGRNKPRASMVEKIRKLYLAQDITGGGEPIYITLVNVGRDLKVGDAVLLEKDKENEHDDEAIMVTVLDLDEPEVVAESESAEIDDDEDDEDWYDGRWDVVDEDGYGCGIGPFGMNYGCPDMDFDVAYVANSVNTVARGTMSAGRLYDRFESKARAQVMFVFHRMAIARIVEWDYSE